jgi:hypothetical protein
VWLIGGTLFRIAVIPPETCPPVTAETARSAAGAGGDWLARGINPDNRFVYGYDKAADQENFSYNTVRHAGVVNSLFQLVLDGQSEFRTPAERGLDFMLARLVQHGDWTAFRVAGEEAKLGANAFVVTALAHRRLATGDRSYDPLMRAVGRFILGQQESDGSISSAWDPANEAPIPGAYGPFATGEAAWALAMLHRAFPEEGWGDAAVLSLDYFADRRRQQKEGYTIALPDHWAAYALAELEPAERGQELNDYAARLAGYFGWRLRFESQRTGEGVNVLVRWYPGPPSGVGTAGEGLASILRLALQDERLSDLVPGMRSHLECFGGMMVEAQIGAGEAASLPSPALAEGAWFYRDYTQMDDQQHVLSGLLQLATILEGDR